MSGLEVGMGSTESGGELPPVSLSPSLPERAKYRRGVWLGLIFEQSLAIEHSKPFLHVGSYVVLIRNAVGRGI